MNREGRCWTRECKRSWNAGNESICEKGKSVLADNVPFLSKHLIKATRTRLARLPGDDEISELGGVAGVLLEPSDSMSTNSTIEE